MTRRLPNLNALKAFEAAARHLSFTQAAAELNVTQGAISHQVQSLEESLGLTLFRRMNRRLALTDAGRAYLPALSEAFDRIAGATERLKAQEETGQLTVTVLPSFAARWLLPRIGRFRRAAPEIDVMVSSRQQLVDLTREPVDCAIRFGLGQGRYPELEETFLMGDTILPVMAPTLRDGRPPPTRPQDLKDYPLLHDEVGDMEPAVDWRRWLAMAGAEEVDWRRGASFTDFGLRRDGRHRRRGRGAGPRQPLSGGSGCRPPGAALRPLRAAEADLSSAGGAREGPVAEDQPLPPVAAGRGGGPAALPAAAPLGGPAAGRHAQSGLFTGRPPPRLPPSCNRSSSAASWR